MVKKQYITNIKYNRGILEVSGFIPRRQWARDLKITIKTKNIKDILSKEYEIIETLREDTISNSAALGYAEHGTWSFKAKKKATKKKPIEKPKQVNEAVIEKPNPPVIETKENLEEPVTEQDTPKETASPKKTSTKRSIRGRISKIAKNSKTKEK